MGKKRRTDAEQAEFEASCTTGRSKLPLENINRQDARYEMLIETERKKWQSRADSRYAALEATHVKERIALQETVQRQSFRAGYVLGISDLKRFLDAGHTVMDAITEMEAHAKGALAEWVEEDND